MRAKLRDAVRKILMTVLQKEVDATVGARPYQRSAGRRDYRNGSYPRGLGTSLGGDPGMLTAIQQWLNGTVLLDKPATLASFGKITIADVYQAPAASGRAQIAQAWIEGVWKAYAPQQALARGCSRQSRRPPAGEKAPSGAPPSGPTHGRSDWAFAPDPPRAWPAPVARHWWPPT